jgi:hypothetical protein
MTEKEHEMYNEQKGIQHVAEMLIEQGLDD